MIGWIILVKLLITLALLLPVSCDVPVATLHVRMVTFCEVYGRSIDCAAWTQGAMATAYDLANECHLTYPPGQDVQMFLCLEEYGM